LLRGLYGPGGGHRPIADGVDDGEGISMRTSGLRVRREPALLLACLLCLATGLTVLGLAATFRAPGGEDRTPTDPAALAVVDRFYAAANVVLRTGDPAVLDTIVAPGFVDHNPAPGTVPDRAGLGRVLAARHATFPGERLVVDHALATGDEVAVRVHAEAAAGGAFLGLPLPVAAGDWGPLETFRAAGEQIVERWGSPASPLFAEPLWQTPSSGIGGGTARTTVFLERRVYAPGDADGLGDDAAARIFCVEAGTLTASGEATDPQAGGRAAPLPSLVGRAGTVPSGTEFTPADLRHPADLTAGDLVAIPPTGRLATHNGGTTAAVAVVVALAPPDRLPAGSATTARVSAETVLPTTGAVAAGRLVLAPGTTLDLSLAAGTILAVVEAGELEVAPPIAGGATATGQTVAAGDGTAVRAGVGGRWRSASSDPVVLFVVALPSTGSGDSTPAT
jgi:SnoaL-like polyketide cyclase